MRSVVIALAIASFSAAVGCDRVQDNLREADRPAEAGQPGPFQYNRDYIFVGGDEEDALVVPFSFQARDDGQQLRRSVRGWLARGATWDRFLDESGRSSRAGGVWRVVPEGDLTVLAGGATEVESLRFERADRRLRLDLGRPSTGWNQDGDARFRLIDGRLTIGGETFNGSILEHLRVDRTADDGWPPAQDFDAMFLTTGDSIQLLLTKVQTEDDANGGFVWLRRGASERTWDGVQLRWVELRPFEDARRDIPRRWTFRVPSGGLVGDVEAAGFDVLLGPERGARRAVEIRYTVQGTVNLGGESHAVTGMIRHTQQ